VTMEHCLSVLLLLGFVFLRASIVCMLRLDLVAIDGMINCKSSVSA